MNALNRLYFPINFPISLFLSVSIVFMLCFQPALGQESVVNSHKFTLGSYYSSGEYGGEQDTSIAYFPLSYEFARFPWVLSFTVPYLALRGPGDVFLETGNIGRGSAGANEFINEKDLADAILSATYQFPPVMNDWVFIDLTVQAKLPTANEKKDLGTGEADFSYQLDFYSTLEENTYFSTFGYRQRGTTPLFDLKDSLYVSLGYMRQLAENTTLGLIYDYREEASSNSFESHEVMPFLSYNLGKQWNLMVYSLFGFTNSSADRTVGLQMSYTLP